MQSAKHMTYRVFLLIFSVLILGIAGGLLSRAGVFGVIPRIVKWIMFLGFVSYHDLLLA